MLWESRLTANDSNHVHKTSKTSFENKQSKKRAYLGVLLYDRRWLNNESW